MVQSVSASTAMKASATVSVPFFQEELLELLKALKIEQITVDGPHRGDLAKDVSYKLLMKLSAKKQAYEMAQPLSNWLSSLQSINIGGEFQTLYETTLSKTNEEYLQKNLKYAVKNRYTDILAFEHSRVVLKRREETEYPETNPEDYINANFVDSPLKVGDQKIIAAQGPIANTIGDFWRMIVQEKVVLIVTTCNLKEGGRSKCEKFWPGDASQMCSIEDEKFEKGIAATGIKVVANGPDEQLTKHLILRTFTVDDSFTNTQGLKVQQLHYTGWPDHGVPSGDSVDSFKLMLDIYILTMLKSAADQKIIVHCSAGIGRTGTTIGLASMILNTWAQRNAGIEDPAISVFSTVRRMREQRYHLVQVPEQYIFMYNFIAHYLQTSFLQR